MSTKNEKHLLTWKEIMPWQRDNEFILTSYRVASFSYAKSIWSAFRIHNETANIWSHCLGAIWFLFSLMQYVEFKRILAVNDNQDSLAIVLYYMSVVMHKFGNELDHLGIVLVMWGTGISGTHFAFHKDEYLRRLYAALLTATGLGCAVFTLQAKFRQPAYRTTRFLMYVFLGTSLFAPVAHGLMCYGQDLEAMMGLQSFLGLAIINFTGAAIYAARIPERWFPRAFDLLGQSHNIMHVMVLTGALVRLHGLLEVARYWEAPV
ncbi:adiponectin receptor protein 1 [Xylariaceae sp. FL0255]|nr:adiponectin receptor protein 1 [Xylariaceae sp. FL0255]